MTASANDPYLLIEFDDDGIVGAVSIEQHVLFEMITLAAESVPATARVVSPRKSRSGKAVTVGSPEGTGRQQDDEWSDKKGVGVRIHGDSLSASVSVLLKPGSSVPDAAKQIQMETGVIVEKMLGLRTESVAVHVLGFTDEAPAQ